ncbi:hypothetical protein NIES2104_28820 [Leptolyngbya sp. NIES-2104]|nr:hypothetical protein NIES2104_28820 [Leptolyngbya sp. NIES-2104]
MNWVLSHALDATKPAADAIAQKTPIDLQGTLPFGDCNFITQFEKLPLL